VQGGALRGGGTQTPVFAHPMGARPAQQAGGGAHMLKSPLQSDFIQ
jgi:hypothetical protein